MMMKAMEEVASMAKGRETLLLWGFFGECDDD